MWSKLEGGFPANVARRSVGEQTLGESNYIGCIGWGNGSIHEIEIRGTTNLGLSFTILALIGLVSFGLAVVFFRKRDLPL